MDAGYLRKCLALENSEPACRLSAAASSPTIPIVLATGGMALLIGGGLAALAYELTEAPVLAALAGVPIGMVLFQGPLLVIGGLYLAFESTVWTLTYRAIRQPQG